MLLRLLAQCCCHVRPAMVPTKSGRFASSTRFFSAAPSRWLKCERVTVPCRSNGEITLEYVHRYLLRLSKCVCVGGGGAPQSISILV
jgi:hypothetical protein